MPPYSSIATSSVPVEEIPCVLENNKNDFVKPIKHNDLKNSYKTLWGTFETELIWFNIIMITAVHLFGIHAFVTFPYGLSKLNFIVFCILYGSIGGFGVTAGAHRLWSHKAYKAKAPLRIILIICYAIAGQNKLYDWVRDHRVHHKFSETMADPHNSNRGFFFAHVGWLFMKKHPEVLDKGKKVDCSDILQDKILVFHDKYFFEMKFFWCFFLPAFISYYCIEESLYYSIMGSIFARLIFNLNCTWAVNSFAHIFGNKPYNKKINPVENRAVAFFAMGEGFHNYHHSFPWDYKAAELGDYQLNVTTMYLDLFAKIGWAYDLKQPSKQLVEKVVASSGDGTHWDHHEVPESEDKWKK